MKVLVFGGSGLVGSKFLVLFDGKLEIAAPRAGAVNILNKDQVLKATQDFNPDSVINFAAYTNVEEAENQTDDQNGIAYQINAIGAKNVAEVCRKTDRHLIHISTEYVFDGSKENVGYVEEDKPNPINWYGKTKYFGEQMVIDCGGKSVIVRISMPYSAFYEIKKDIARSFLEQLKNEQKVYAVCDQNITPTLVDDIAHSLMALIENQTLGIYHISAEDSVTPLDFAKTIAETFRLDYSLVTSVSLEEYNKSKKAKLLKNSALNPAKFEKEFGEGILHTVEEGIQLFKKAVDQLS